MADNNDWVKNLEEPVHDLVGVIGSDKIIAQSTAISLKRIADVMVDAQYNLSKGNINAALWFNLKELAYQTGLNLRTGFNHGNR